MAFAKDFWAGVYDRSLDDSGGPFSEDINDECLGSIEPSDSESRMGHDLLSSSRKHLRAKKGVASWEIDI